MPRGLSSPQLLWTIVSTAAAANERVVGITGDNPLRIKPYYTGAVFFVAVTAKNNYTLTRVGVGGSMDGVRLAPPGLDDMLFTMTRNLLLDQGVVRAPSIFSNPTIMPGAVTLLPEFLFVEYSGTVGASPTITIEVRAAFIADAPFGLE